MLNKHQLKTEVTRRKLVAAGLRVFARDGFEGARIEDIAAAAGHTRGAFYAHFKTKEDLFLALLEQQAAKRIEQLQEFIKDVPSPAARLKGVRTFYLSCAANRQWTMLVLEFKLFALRHSKQRAKLAAAHQRIRESLNFELLGKLLPPRRELRDLDVEKTKILFEVLLSGLVLEHAYDPKRISAGQMVRLLGRAFDLLTEIADE